MASFGITVNGAGMSGRIYYTLTDNADNTTTVYAEIQVSKSSNYTKTWGTGTWTLSIGSDSKTVTKSFTVNPGDSNITVMSNSAIVTHNADGTKSVTISSSGGISGTTWTVTSGSSSIALTDFSRIPAKPSAKPTVTRVGKILTITSATSPDLVPIGPSLTDYIFQYSTNNGSSWSSPISMGLDKTINWTVPAYPATYLIKTAAVSSEGTGTYSDPSTGVFVSAFGNRFELVNNVLTKTPVSMAARFTGVATDSVIINGSTYTGWKQVNVKKWNGTSWVDLEA